MVLRQSPAPRGTTPDKSPNFFLNHNSFPGGYFQGELSEVEFSWHRIILVGTLWRRLSKGKILQGELSRGGGIVGV